MKNINYGRMLDEKLDKIVKNVEKPTLMLHACCAPCSSHTLLFLYNYFDIIVYFCNPNIAPEQEYEHRKKELKRFIAELKLSVKLINEDYNTNPFYYLSKGLETLLERGERCQKCITYRLRETAKKALENRCEYFTTTMTISPHKDYTYINQCGGKLGDELGVKYLFSDFKKHDGYKHSIELSKQYSLYRQNYCGCIYSRIESQSKKQKKILHNISKSN